MARPHWKSWVILSASQSKPYWQDYLPFLHLLKNGAFPGCRELNDLLPPGLKSAGGHTIRFVPSELLDDEPYESRIYTSGRVSTRPDNWHDLFNALVWMRYPRIKTAMNSLHYHAGAQRKCGRRGRLRDALTLFDECGVIVFSDRLELLGALAERRWANAFLADTFGESVGLSICGHAMLEKYLTPYKSMTAKALLLHVSPDCMRLSRNEALKWIDREVATEMLSSRIVNEPACLSPLPLAGIPGWWVAAEQESKCFYSDLRVFRPAPSALNPAPVINFFDRSNGPGHAQTLTPVESATKSSGSPTGAEVTATKYQG